MIHTQRLLAEDRRTRAIDDERETSNSPTKRELQCVFVFKMKIVMSIRV